MKYIEILLTLLIIFIGITSLKAETWIATNPASQNVNWYSIPQMNGLNVNWQSVGGINGNSMNWTDVRVYGTKFGGDHSGINWQSFGV